MEYIVQLEDLFSRFGSVETWKQNFVGEWAAHRADFDAVKEWQTVTEAWIEETVRRGYGEGRNHIPPSSSLPV